MEGIRVGTVANFLEELNLASHHKKGTSLLTKKPTKDVENSSEGNSEITDVLHKVEEDLQNIKQEILSSIGNKSGEELDYDRVKTLFENAERKILKQKQDAVSKFSTKASTLATSAVLQKSQSSPTVRQDTSMSDEKVALVQTIQRKVGPGMASPGKQSLALQKLKSIINPGRGDSRKVLNQNYGVPLPTESNAQEREVTKFRQPITGSTIPNLNQPKRLTPSKLTEEDTKLGMFSLLERRLIPAATQLTLDPSPVKMKPVKLHGPLDPYQRNLDAAASRPKYNMSLVKFDDKSIVEAVANEMHKQQRANKKGDSFLPNRINNPFTSSGIYDPSETYIGPVPTQYGMELVPAPTPMAITREADLPIAGTSHKFVIQNGIVQTTSQDFIHFKQYYCLSWGSVLGYLNKLEKLMMDYSIPIAFVDGDKLADLSLYFEAGPPPTIKDLLLCVLNGSDVEKIIMIPGRRYMSSDGQEMAAIKIQSTYRCHALYAKYLQYRRQKWAAGIIALSWIMCCKMTMMKRQLREMRILHLRNFKERTKYLGENWTKIQSSKRVIIHIPSLGYSTDTRELMDDINIMQNLQIGRICDIKDPFVSVIYICPIAMSEELHQYYTRLVEVMASVCELDPDELNSRLTILTPSAINSFPFHNMCLSTVLKYSSRTLTRLKSMIAGKSAYIVPGLMHVDDLGISDFLGIPILGAEPEVAQIYSMKSGAKRIFNGADVAAPPGAHDIYSVQELHESLARLVAGNLHVTRWLFKIDNEFNGRGTAHCDVTPHLSCHAYAMKEAARYGDKWTQRWAQDPTFVLILREIGSIIEQHTTVVDRDAYPTFEIFLESFLRHGGLIEACPPAESVTSLSANLLIDPTGNVSMLSVTDQIHSKSEYKCWGHSLPQSSIDQQVINEAVQKIAAAAMARGVVGYVSVNFITFIDSETMSQVLWAVDLDLEYSRSLAMVGIVSFLTDGILDAHQNSLKVDVLKNPPRLNVAYQSKRKKMPDQSQVLERLDRCAVFSSNMHHSNLNNIHYNVFFQMCKAKGIGYDNKVKIGTAFTLVDSIHKHCIGMLTIGESLQSTLTSFMNNMVIIHDEISAPSMPGVSNFQGAISDIKAILNITDVNMELDQSEIGTRKADQSEKGSDDAKSRDSVRTSQSARMVPPLDLGSPRGSSRLVQSATHGSSTRIQQPASGHVIETHPSDDQVRVRERLTFEHAHKIPTAQESDENVEVSERGLFPTPADDASRRTGFDDSD